MSPAVFSIRSSMVRLAVLIRWFTPAGTASRKARRSAARRWSSRERQLGIVEHACLIEHATEIPKRAVAARPGERSLDVLEGFGRVRSCSELQLHEQRERSPVRH